MSHYRKTLPTDQLIPDGVARRLFVEHGFSDVVYTNLEITDHELEAIQDYEYPESCRDQHHYAAERRALLDWMAFHRLMRTPMEYLSRVRTSYDVVPWAYGKGL